MKRITLLSIFLSLALFSLNGQSTVDALRYSQITFGGTARYMAMGGAFGALGADFSTLSTNPAGIGLYKKSEFTFTPSVYWSNVSSLYNGFMNEDTKANFNLGNVGMIVTYDNEKYQPRSEWKNMQFGFGLNRYNNFNNRYIMEGPNMDNSLLNYYNDLADGIYYDNLYDPPNNFDLGPAFDTYLLDTLPGETSFYSNAAPVGGVWQRKAVESTGSMNEFLFSMGGNYNDRLYVGATIGIPFIRYFEESKYTEEAMYDTLAYEEFKQFSVRQNLEARGTGFNFKFGLIYRVQDWLRIGAAIHTPSFFNIQEDWRTKTDSYFDNGDHYYSSSPYGEYEYKLNTPWRAIGSIGFVIGKIGVVSADYEYVDYGNMRFRTPRNYGSFDDFSDLNYDIREYYSTAHNIRIGTEWRVNNIAFRGGYAFYGSPYKSDFNDGARTSYSGGIGYREQNFFIDFAYVYTTSKEDYYFYDKSYVNPVKNETVSNSIVTTIGFRF